MSFVQSVLFNKKYFDINQCYKWLINHKFKITAPDITKKYYRFRQKRPNYKKYYYRIKKINPMISFIIGYLR